MPKGVDVIFGYPGGAILPTYDALLDSKIKHVLVRHEQGATHMAEGFARVTGKPGVVLVTSGPGATNTVTGIADAYMDSTPMVVLVGSGPAPRMIGNDAFQEADFVGITRPCTKHNFLVKNVKDISRIIKEAFYIAGSGRPGPVVVDLPKDVQQAEHTFHPSEQDRAARLQADDSRSIRGKSSARSSDRKKFDGHCSTSAAACNGPALRPSCRELVRGLGIPITETLMGLGSFPASDSLRLGMLGMHGSYGTNTAVCNTDCLIAVGARFDDRVTGKYFPISRRKPKRLSISISTRRRFRRTSRSIFRSSAISSRCSPTC